MMASDAADAKPLPLTTTPWGIKGDQLAFSQRLTVGRRSAEAGKAGSALCVLRDGRFRGLLRMRNFLNVIKALSSS